jgi:hypothetical protein
MTRLLTLGLLLGVALFFSGDPARWMNHSNGSSASAPVLNHLSGGTVHSTGGNPIRESQAGLLTAVPGQNVLSMAIPGGQPTRFLLIGASILGLVLIRRLLN